MNLLFRLMWMMVTARWHSSCAMPEESCLSFRVMPTDLDVNMHLTNSRYFSFMEMFGHQGDLPPMTEALMHIRDADDAVMEIATS